MLPGLGMGSLELGQLWQLAQPASRGCFSLFPLPGRQDSLRAWDEFYLHHLPGSVSSCVPMDIPPQGHPLRAWWPCREPGDILHAAQSPSGSPKPDPACFPGDAFPLSLGFCNPRPPRAIYSPGFAVDLTFQSFPRTVFGPAGCGRIEYFQHFLIRLKNSLFSLLCNSCF